MENIRSFRELRVWQKSMDLAMAVFTATRNFPVEERYSLSDQVRRSARSVPANIAEAWRKRRYPAAFVSKLNDAEGEAAETQTHLEISLRCGYLPAGTVQQLDQAYEEVLGMLVNMASHPEQWVIRQGEPKPARSKDTQKRPAPSSPRPRVPASPRPPQSAPPPPPQP